MGRWKETITLSLGVRGSYGPWRRRASTLLIVPVIVPRLKALITHPPGTFHQLLCNTSGKFIEDTLSIAYIRRTVDRWHSWWTASLHSVNFAMQQTRRNDPLNRCTVRGGRRYHRQPSSLHGQNWSLGDGGTGQVMVRSIRVSRARGGGVTTSFSGLNVGPSLAQALVCPRRGMFKDVDLTTDSGGNNYVVSAAEEFQAPHRRRCQGWETRKILQ